MTSTYASLMTTAHQNARLIRREGESYRGAFAVALKAAWLTLKAHEAALKTRIEEKKTVATSTEKTVTYKGKTYRLLWSGQTKFGRRAKLGFVDGSSEFWVDEKALGGPAAVPTAGQHLSGQKKSFRRAGDRCPCCGKSRRLHYDMEDGLMKCFDCCDMPAE